MSLVYKFGGSTIKCADTIRTIAQVVKDSKGLRGIVLSATYNTTNELEALSKAPKSYEMILQKHLSLAHELGLSSYEEYSKSLYEEFTNFVKTKLPTDNPMDLDSLLSFGERFSTQILFLYLKDKLSLDVVELDAREIIKTNSNFQSALPLFNEIGKCFNSVPNRLFITQGFVGSNLKGETTTLGREGSDYTASIFSWLLNVNELIIWKDVDGIMECDPKTSNKGKLISNLSYSQAKLLTENGAKVLFSRTMNPLERKGISLRVKNIVNPDGTGTKIDENNSEFFSITKRNYDQSVLVSVIGSDFFEKNVFSKLEEKLYNFELSFEYHNQNDDLCSVIIAKEHESFVVDLLFEIFSDK